MDLVQHALQTSRGAAVTAAANVERRGLVVGAAGSLGAAVLEKALGIGRFAPVGGLGTPPLSSALRGFEAVLFEGFGVAPLATPDTAWIVLDRARRATGPEDSFYRPQPQQLPQIARWLRAAGVRRLVVVLPHAPGLLPQALQRGLASLDEHAVATLGFEQLVFVRSAARVAAADERHWARRIARFVLSQLRWMVPQREQAVRSETVATFVAQLAVGLDDATPATRVAPPELVWQAAQTEDVAGLVRSWLDTGRWRTTDAKLPRM
jgi:hypothetical protein